MKLVEINCPRSINLKNINSIKNNNIKYLLQSVDIYDKVIISQNIKHNGIFIKSIDTLNNEFEKEIKEIIDIYSKYTGINVDNINIIIEKNKNILFVSKYGILANILIGLNIYYNNKLTIHELFYVASLVNNYIGFYLVCGYREIEDNDKIYNHMENIFKKYLLFSNLSSENKLRIMEYVCKHKLSYNDENNYFIAFKENEILKDFLNVKKEFKDIKLYEFENVSKNKILKKYLTFNK